MGLSLSINQSNYQETSNQISQISNEECINYVTNDTEIVMDIDGGTYGNIDISVIALLNSPSCILKASLDSSLINTLSNKQSAQITDMAGLFTALDALARIGGSDSISQSNYQKIMNESTQQLNSLCKNYTGAEEPIILNFTDAKIRNINIKKLAQSNKSDCVINNMVKSYISNNESNDQTAKITRMGIMGIILVVIIIIIIGVVMRHHKNHKKADASDSSSISFGNDDTGELAEALFNDKGSSRSSTLVKAAVAGSIGTSFANAAFGSKGGSRSSTSAKKPTASKGGSRISSLAKTAISKNPAVMGAKIAATKL